MQYRQNYLFRFAAIWILAAGFALNAPAGTIGGTNTDWNSWTEVAGLPAARTALAAGVLNSALYAVGGFVGNSQTNVYRYPGLTVFSGVSPESGSVTGGYQVTISGTGLGDGSDITNVTLAGFNASSINS